MSPFVQTGRHAESLAQEVQRVKGFSLRVADGRDRREGDWRATVPEPHVTRPVVLQQRAVGRLAVWAGGRVAEQQAAHESV